MFTNKTKTPDIEPIIRPRHYRENNRLASFRFLFLFFFLMIRREMIYSSVITAREVSRWRTRCTCLFFCVYKLYDQILTARLYACFRHYRRHDTPPEAATAAAAGPRAQVYLRLIRRRSSVGRTVPR